MDPFCAPFLPAQRGLKGIAITGFCARLTLEKPHGLSVDDVHRGEKFQVRHKRCSFKLFTSFSGPLPMPAWRQSDLGNWNARLKPHGAILQVRRPLL